MYRSQLLNGALAGCIATAPMTAVMEALFRWLPRGNKYPLPPSEITTKVARDTGLHENVDHETHLFVTLVNHFAYGAAAGAIYGPLAPAVPLPAALRGIAWGLIVWLVSYLGLLPALGILRPATEHPPARNLLMIAAHGVWGAVLGVLADRWARRTAG